MEISAVCICEQAGSREDLLALLLQADPDRAMVERYLHDGRLLVARSDEQVLGVLLMVPLDANGWEIKNLSVDARYWRRGIGRTLIQAACAKLPAGTILYVGTAPEVGWIVQFYQSCGFAKSYTVKGFFLDHYPQPVYDNGIHCKDMLYLRMQLPNQGDENRYFAAQNHRI